MGGFSSASRDFTLVIVHIHLHLPEVLVRERPDLQVDQHERASEPVVENQVDPEVLAVDRDPLLAGHECKTLAEFQQELAELVDQGLLQVRFQESARSAGVR